MSDACAYLLVCRPLVLSPCMSDNSHIEELQKINLGQSYDLFWTCNIECPTVSEYLNMIDASKAHNSRLLLLDTDIYSETGGLFRMLVRLMAARSPISEHPAISNVVTLFGRYFQIRDDYQNLVSADVSVSAHLSYMKQETNSWDSCSTRTRKDFARTSMKENIPFHLYMLCRPKSPTCG